MSRDKTTGDQHPRPSPSPSPSPSPDEALHEALEEALGRVAAGASREEALDAADPALREALSGLLAAASLAGSADTPPSPAFAARGRSDLEARLAAAPRAPLPLPRRRPARRNVLRGLGALAASVLFLIGLGVASANAGPGDWLYTLHSAWERSETRLAAWLARGDEAGAEATTPESGAREGGAPDAADGASVREKDETSGPEADGDATGSREASARAMRDRTAIDDAAGRAAPLVVRPSAAGLAPATSTAITAAPTVAPTFVGELVSPGSSSGSGSGSGDPPQPEPQDPTATEPPPSATTPSAATATPSPTAPPPSAASATPSPTATDVGPVACVVQDGRIEGTVTWRPSPARPAQPVEGALVEALPAALDGPGVGGHGSTDAEGAYSIEGLCEGDYQVKATLYDAAGTILAEAFFSLDPNGTPSRVEIRESQRTRTSIDIELAVHTGAGPTPTPTSTPTSTPTPTSTQQPTAPPPTPTTSPTVPPRVLPTETPTPSATPTPGRPIGP